MEEGVRDSFRTPSPESQMIENGECKCEVAWVLRYMFGFYPEKNCFCFVWGFMELEVAVEYSGKKLDWFPSFCLYFSNFLGSSEDALHLSQHPGYFVLVSLWRMLLKFVRQS